jgi:hypothetical protein
MAETDCIPTCKCGKPLKRFVSSGRYAAACGPSCYPSIGLRVPQVQRPNHPCADCGKPVWSGSVRCKKCNGLRVRKIADSLCKGCGKTFKPKRRRESSYCSRECAFEHKTTPERKAQIVAADEARKTRWSTRIGQHMQRNNSHHIAQQQDHRGGF